MIKYTIDNIAYYARPAHGDKFKYLDVFRKGKSHRCYVKYECPEHGLVESRIYLHLSGYGCKYCSGRATTKSTFIEKARTVHGDKYDYSLVELSTVLDKVRILCDTHGEFEQKADAHLSGAGCKKCLGFYRDTESFVIDAKTKHGDVYDYSFVKYVNAKTKVKIICNTHGEFWQIPRAHLQGKGCSVCGGTDLKTTDMFIDQCIRVHGYKYDYSKTKYAKGNKKVKIVCPEHGEFSKLATVHLSGKGCPSCAITAFSVIKPSVFYVYTTDKFIGFGITNVFRKRHKRHLSNLAKSGVRFVSVETFDMLGEVALDLETFTKREFSGRILNTGIEGFKREAVDVNCKDELLNFIVTFLGDTNVKENPRSRHRKRT